MGSHAPAYRPLAASLAALLTDPDAVRTMRDTADRDLGIGGPHLAAHALRAGLVDEVGLFVYPWAAATGCSPASSA